MRDQNLFRPKLHEIYVGQERTLPWTQYNKKVGIPFPNVLHFPKTLQLVLDTLILSCRIVKVHFLGSPLTYKRQEKNFAQTKTAAIDKSTNQLFSLSTTRTASASHLAGTLSLSVYYAALVEAQVHGSDSSPSRVSHGTEVSPQYRKCVGGQGSCFLVAYVSLQKQNLANMYDF